MDFKFKLLLDYIKYICDIIDFDSILNWLFAIECW